MAQHGKDHVALPQVAVPRPHAAGHHGHVHHVADVERRIEPFAAEEFGGYAVAEHAVADLSDPEAVDLRLAHGLPVGGHGAGSGAGVGRGPQSGRGAAIGKLDLWSSGTTADG